MTIMVRASVGPPGGTAPTADAGGWDADVSGPAVTSGSRDVDMTGSAASGGSSRGIGVGTAAASLALAGAGVASTFGGGVVGGRLGAAGVGRGVGLAMGVAAIAGAGYLLLRGSGNATTEYVVGFRQQPDLSGVAPGEVYATLREHHQRNAPAVERELVALKDEGRVRGYSGIVGANGFVVDVVNRHRGEVEQRLAAVQEVGSVEAAPLA